MANDPQYINSSHSQEDMGSQKVSPTW